MNLPTGKHGQLHYIDENGVDHKLLPITVAEDTAIDNTQNEHISNLITTLQELIDALGSFAFINELETASTSQPGIVQLSSSTDSSSETEAATPAAVKTVDEGAAHNTGDEDIAGVKNFEDGIALSSNVAFTSEEDPMTGDVTTTISFVHPEPEP